MAITYPLALPYPAAQRFGFSTVKLRAMNVTGISESPFTKARQVFAWPGEGWAADVTIPRTTDRVRAEAWIAFLIKLHGRAGTFLLGDPSNIAPRGTAVANGTATGTAGSNSVTVTLTGSVLTGDMVQIGVGAAATLHKVLSDRSGNGVMDIWPALRRNVSPATMVVVGAVGNFRLAVDVVEYDVDTAMTYGIAFSCQEVIQ